MKKAALTILASLLLSPCAFAEEAISPDSITWRDNYKKGVGAMKHRDFKAAEVFLDKAHVAATKFKPGDSRLFATLSELMSLDIQTRQDAKYEAHRDQERAAYVKAFGPEYGMIGILDEYRATSLDRQGKYAEAEKTYKNSIAILEKAYGADNPLLAEACNRLAVFYWETGNAAESLKLIKQEEAILLKMKPAYEEGIVGNLSLQGYIYESLGMPKEAQAAHAKLYTLKSKIEMEADEEVPKE